MVVDVFMQDPAPHQERDKEERKSYVARVASHHTEILKPRLEFMTSNLMHIMKDETTPLDQIQTLRGSIYVLEELNRWGDLLVAEQQDNHMKKD
jgi:hypothetical protein